MGKIADTGPGPQLFDPLTVRFPEVAEDEKIPEIVAVFPEGVNPTPE
jgi:hypothetical protein